jgi:hypothetical protein
MVDVTLEWVSRRHGGRPIKKHQILIVGPSSCAGALSNLNQDHVYLGNVAVL